MITLSSGQKNWNCPHKKEARRTTIIEPYRSIFGQSLPSTKQYWTLCGEMGINGSISPGCELSQMVEEGLIKPKQFHGIEGNPEIHNNNKRAIGKTKGPSLYCGEFVSVLDKVLGSGQFKPGIIYLDTIQEPKKSVELLSLVFDIVNQTVGKTMVVWNFVQGNKYRGRMFSWEEIQREAVSNYRYCLAVQKWKQFKKDFVFSYGGTGRSSTTMGSVVYYRT